MNAPSLSVFLLNELQTLLEEMGCTQEVDINTVIFGNMSSVESIVFVSFISLIEEKLLREYAIDIDIFELVNSEWAGAESLTINMLSAYITSTINT
jgi:hypothetical protein